MTVGGREVVVDELIFYVDASHNDSRGMQATGLAFNFVSWEGQGFMNRYVEDVDVKREDGKRLHGKKGEIFHRKPMFHKLIMELIGENKIVSIANAGTIVYRMTRNEFLQRFEN